MNLTERINKFCAFMGDNVNGIITEKLLKETDFFTAPASTKYHGSYEGGLFDHSLMVAETLVKLTEDNNLKWQLSRSPYIVGMFHDLCKADNYLQKERCPEDNTAYTYNENTLFKGHGDKSVMLLSQFYKLNEEEIAAIRYHMGAFVDKDEWRDYTRAVNKYPNVLWTHHADMIASHVKGV